MGRCFWVSQTFLMTEGNTCKITTYGIKTGAPSPSTHFADLFQKRQFSQLKSGELLSCRYMYDVFPNYCTSIFFTCYLVTYFPDKQNWIYKETLQYVGLINLVAESNEHESLFNSLLWVPGFLISLKWSDSVEHELSKQFYQYLD